MDDNQFNSWSSGEEALITRLNRLQEENEELRISAKADQMKMQQKLRLSEHRTDQLDRKYSDLVNSRIGKLLLFIQNIANELRQEKARSGKLFLLKWIIKKLRNFGKKNQDQIPQMRIDQERWVEAYIDRIARIPDSNGCRYYEKLPTRIGIICDEFFYESISAAADFVFITPENWQEKVEEGLDALLFVTAWRGLHEEWRGLGAVKNMESNPKRKLALNILDTCKEKRIPTIFYSKEDPPNYDVFLDYAKHCDYITTTAEECVPAYRTQCQNEHVRAVSFGINPLNHNPIGFRSGEKENCVLFSGSWMLKYPDRCAELSAIFDGILKSGYGLHIIDRNAPGNPRYRFPEKYFPYTSPALPHDLLQKVHKLFDWAVNINSVKASRTMFANRAYELQANGVLLMSNYSRGVNELLPMVQIVAGTDEVPAILNSLTGEALYERQIAGVRSVMTGHTCFDRIGQILKPVGLKTDQPERSVLVLADQLTESLQRMFDRQTYPNKALRLATDISPQVLEQYDMVAWFAADAEYGAYYLEDMINGFKYTACRYITKDAWYEGQNLHSGKEHNYVNKMTSKYRTVFWRGEFSADFLLGVSGALLLENGYSIDRFNFNAIAASPCEKETQTLLTVVIPVRGSGRHLFGKAFASLRRSSIFKKLEVLLVDQGVTEDVTRKRMGDLARHCPNTRIVHADRAEGIWSAAVQAQSPYVTILTPEAEAINDGYAKMLSDSQGQDLLLANIFRMDVKPTLQNRYERFVQEQGADRTDSGMGRLCREEWGMEELQAVVFRKSLIQSLSEDYKAISAARLLQSARSCEALDLPAVMAYPSLEKEI